MAKRSITNQEISLIKAMLAKGMKNKDVQFFFNRPDRPVNSGRITDISNGSYSDSSTIAPASDAALGAFLKSFKPVGVAATVSVPGVGYTTTDDGPMSEAVILSMFVQDSGGKWRFHLGESDRHECKEGFRFKYADKWLRAVAALANNSGGYVLFGVKDKDVENRVVSPDSYLAQGLPDSEFENADPAEFSKVLKSFFDPTPKIETKTVTIGVAKIGVMYVHQHRSPPIIATKGGGKINEGDIFYRYPGQSARIKYSDLRALLDDRDRHARSQILPMVEELLRLGPMNAMVADLSDGLLRGGDGNILLDEKLVNQIKFVKEGEFKEKDGAAALRLVGDVTAVGSGPVTVQKTFVTVDGILEDFLKQEIPYEPKDYIRCAIEAGNGAWLPVHYFAGKAGFTIAQLKDFVEKVNAPKSRRETFRDRLIGVSSAFSEAKGTPREYLDDLKAGNLLMPSSEKDAIVVSRAIAGLEAKGDVPLEKLLSFLSAAKEILQDSSKASAMSVVRRAIARVDELFFQIT